MSFAIVKNLEMPDPTAYSKPGGGGLKYPFRKMEVGDAFVVTSEKDRGRAMSAANMYVCTAHGKGRRYASRRTPDGYGVWRIA